MKKIFILLLSTIFIFNIKPVSLEKINLSLMDNELGILFINVDNNKGLLLSLNNINIIYLFECNNYNQILKYIKPLNINVNYVITNDDFNVNGDKRIFNNYLYLNNIIFNRKEYIMINYNDKTLCINPKYNNCDYVYYTNDDEININDNTKVLLYNDNISNDKFYDKWIDSYKITDKVYTFMKIGNSYEVLQLLKNI